MASTLRPGRSVVLRPPSRASGHLLADRSIDHGTDATCRSVAQRRDEQQCAGAEKCPGPIHVRLRRGGEKSRRPRPSRCNRDGEPGHRRARLRARQCSSGLRVAGQQAALREPRQCRAAFHQMHSTAAAMPRPTAPAASDEGEDVEGQRGRPDRTRPARAQPGHHRRAVAERAHETEKHCRRPQQQTFAGEQTDGRGPARSQPPAAGRLRARAARR